MASWPFRRDKTPTKQHPAGTVEELLAQVDDLAVSNLMSTPERVRLWVTSELRWQQEPVAKDMAMAIVLDALLDKGFMPDGFIEAEGGRWYEYAR